MRLKPHSVLAGLGGMGRDKSQSQGLESNQRASAYEADRETACVPWLIHNSTKIMNQIKELGDTEPEWITTPEGKAWLKEARSHRKTIGLIIGDWEICSTIDILDSHPIGHWVEEIFRKAYKKWPDKTVTIVFGNLNFERPHDRRDITPEAEHLRDQLEIGWIKTGDDRYRIAAEKIDRSIVEWRNLISI